MRLLKLSANNASFRTVVFNRIGLSFIIAEQRAPKTNRTKTYNGVGKTLTLAIIDYCLGSSPKSAFKNHLKDWTFYLEIETDDGTHVIARSADLPGNILLDQNEITLKDLKQFLEKASFSIPPEIPYLTFRSLLGHFLRFGKGSYNDYRHVSIEESKNEYAVMLRNAFLLGLDVGLVKTKQDLRKQQLILEETMKQLGKDPLFAEIIADDTVDIELTALKEQYERLQRDLSDFRVAENYHDIEKEADDISRSLDRLRRESVKLEQAVEQIERSLKTKADLPPDRVYQLYEEAHAKLSDIVIKSIEEVLAFQESLKAKRIFRLTQDRQGLKTELHRILEEIKAESASLDERMRYLGEHRAFDEFVAVRNESADLQIKIAKLEESKSIRERALDRQRQLKLDLAEQNITTAAYLESSKDLVAEAAALFRSFARRMYGPRRSGLVVSSDDGENQQRYKIEAHIDSDAAEGIGEARLFCYDFTLLTLGRGHRVKFLVHDSTLFGPVDPRQRLTMIQVAAELAAENGMQYIATLNEHDVTSIQSQLDLKEGEFDKLFDGANVVLRLSDERPEKKLLGMNVDMNYLEE